MKESVVVYNSYYIPKTLFYLKLLLPKNTIIDQIESKNRLNWFCIICFLNSSFYLSKTVTGIVFARRVLLFGVSVRIWTVWLGFVLQTIEGSSRIDFLSFRWLLFTFIASASASASNSTTNFILNIITIVDILNTPFARFSEVIVVIWCRIGI